MPIQLPNLDDRRFTDLVEEGRNMIPGLAPGWTDHNLSDPGITLIELFAAVSEQLMYRTNRITVAHKQVFQRLLPAPDAAVAGQPLDDALTDAIRHQRIEHRAITAADYERIACAIRGVARARCLPRTQPGGSGKDLRLEYGLGHVLLLLVPTTVVIPETAQEVRNALLNVKALTTDSAYLHVLVAQPLHITVEVALAPLADYQLDHGERAVGAAVASLLSSYFDRLQGGADGRGWPLGQTVYLSAVYALLGGVAGVDYVDTVVLTPDHADRVIPGGIAPRRHEYVELTVKCRLPFAQQEGQHG